MAAPGHHPSPWPLTKAWDCFFLLFRTIGISSRGEKPQGKGRLGECVRGGVGRGAPEREGNAQSGQRKLRRKRQDRLALGGLWSRG